ncbi:aquaporin [Candidatus Saccharibacteria bacterium]|nr:aquaporin [Candidatus Saccharibacteria bacterium]
MAKSKKSGKKPKTTRISAKDDETFEKKEVREEMTEKKEVKTETKAEKVAEKDQEAAKKETAEKAESGSEKAIASAKAEKSEKKAEKCGFCKRFFAKKYEEQESVLTIFKQKKIWGALLGEVFGTMMLSMVILTLGLYQPLYMFFILLAIVAAVGKLSGAVLNPINTVGLMATRRISVVRGFLYLLAQLVGAWAGFLVVAAFMNVAAGISGTEAELPGMTMATEGYYWVVTFLEFLGAAIVGFFFARAWEARKTSLVTFGAVAAGGLTLAMVVVYLLSYQTFGLTGNFMLNPAVALMYQILPTSADGVSELLLEIVKALFTYVVFPMVGGVVGFYLADLADNFDI